MRETRIGVVYLTDGNRDDLTYASAIALGLNHKRGIDIHVVQAGFTSQPPDSVFKALQSRGHRLATHFLLPANRGLEGHGHITSTAYAKLEAIEAMSNEYDTVCYLDNDTLAVRPLDLAAATPRTQPLAAVPDLSISTGLDYPDFFDNCRKHGLEPRYFNSGMFVLDTARWRDSGIPRRYESCLKAHAEFCCYRDGPCNDLDQCALNLAARGAWETLPLAFNVQKSAFQTRLWDAARIRHYTGSDKFLPMRPYRTDHLEHTVIASIAKACPELGLVVPNRYLGLGYQANRLRRSASRRRISRLIEKNLASEGSARAFEPDRTPLLREI